MRKKRVPLEVAHKGCFNDRENGVQTCQNICPDLTTFVKKQSTLCGASGAHGPSVFLQKWLGPDQFFDGSLPNFLCCVNSLPEQIFQKTTVLFCFQLNFFFWLNGKAKQLGYCFVLLL